MRRRPLSEINIVPYIDVMLVLLVIFMITSPLLTQGINVKLSQAKEKVLSPQQEPPIIISINNQGDYFLNISDDSTQPISTKELITQVSTALQISKKNHQRREIYVKGNNEVGYGKVVHMIALLKQAGVSSVNLLARNPW